MSHDLQRVAEMLTESLSQNRHPLGILIGAGCPTSIRIPKGKKTVPLIPAIGELTKSVLSHLKDDKKASTVRRHIASTGGPPPNIEKILTQVRLLRRVVAAGSVLDLNATDLETLEKNICDHIVSAVNKPLPAGDNPYRLFAEWVHAYPRDHPLNIFTTNYDLLMEEALDDERVPYFDGFIGARRPFFDIEAIEDESLQPRWVRFWKLHGSISWKLLPNGGVVRSNSPLQTKDGVLIHPSELKYDQSRRMPYLAMIDQLRAFLRRPTAVLITCGYSFSDEHLNEAILQSLRTNGTAAAFALLHEKLSNEKGAEKVLNEAPNNINFIARDEGSIRGKRANWTPEPAEGDANQEKKVESEWGNFDYFSRHLKTLSPQEGRA